MSQEEPKQFQGNGPYREEPQEKPWPKKVIISIKVALVLSVLYYIAMFSIGIWGVHRCPIDDNIPFFLIVIGGIGLWSKFVSLLRGALIFRGYPVQHVETSLYTIELVFMVFGSYWVFKIFEPNYDESSLLYCNKTVYLFAFVYLIVHYSVLLLICVIFCCVITCACFIVKKEKKNANVESGNPPLRNGES